MSIIELKKQLRTKTTNELIEEIALLYKKYDAVKRHYQASLLNDESTVLEHYKSVIKEEFYPKNKNALPKCRLAVAKKAISDYKKAACNDYNVADIMVFYVEIGVQFTIDYGDIDELFYNSMESVFNMALKFIEKTNQQSIFTSRLKSILDNTEKTGWGFHDALSEIYNSHFSNFD